MWWPELDLEIETPSWLAVAIAICTGFAAAAIVSLIIRHFS